MAGLYVNNKNLLEEIEKSMENLDASNGDVDNKEDVYRAVTPLLTEYLHLMVVRITSKASWNGYSWSDIMISEALAHVISVSLKFDAKKAIEKNPNATPNPFAYYTRIIENSLIYVWKDEMRQLRIRDAIIERHGTKNPGEPLKVSHRRLLETLETDTSGYVLDGTVGNPNVVKKSRVGRPRKVKTVQSEMTKGEYQKWLDEKKQEYYDSLP